MACKAFISWCDRSALGGQRLRTCCLSPAAPIIFSIAKVQKLSGNAIVGWRVLKFPTDSGGRQLKLNPPSMTRPKSW
jgi:hypothetical protein